MTIFMKGEQEQCCSVPVGALYGGLRISQWHKLCWSRAGVTLAGTTSQPRQSRNCSLLLYFIRFYDPYLRRWAVSYSSQTSLFSTVVLSVWSFLWSFAVVRAVSAGKLTGKLAPMPECGPPSIWMGRPECECRGKAVRRSVISSDAIFRLYRDPGRTSWFCCWETTTLGVTQAQRTSRAKKVSLQQTEYSTNPTLKSLR